MILLKSAIIRVFVEVFPPQRHLPREYFYDFFFHFQFLIFWFLLIPKNCCMPTPKNTELKQCRAQLYKVDANQISKPFL